MRGDAANMHQATVEWQRQLGGEMNDFARKVRPHTKLLARFNTKAETCMNSRMTRFGEPPWKRMCYSRKTDRRPNELCTTLDMKKHQAVERMREEARSFAAQESNTYGIAEKQHSDLLGSPNAPTQEAQSWSISCKCTRSTWR